MSGISYPPSASISTSLSIEMSDASPTSSKGEDGDVAEVAAEVIYGAEDGAEVVDGTVDGAEVAAEVVDGTEVTTEVVDDAVVEHLLQLPTYNIYKASESETSFIMALLKKNTFQLANLRYLGNSKSIIIIIIICPSAGFPMETSTSTAPLLWVTIQNSVRRERQF